MLFEIFDTYEQAWPPQRALDSCPFGTDRRMVGGRWQYRTSSLIKAEPVVRVHVCPVKSHSKSHFLPIVCLTLRTLRRYHEMPALCNHARDNALQVAPRYGKTSFPARKELKDVVAVIADKHNERSKVSS